jgi:hypothetical protein
MATYIQGITDYIPKLQPFQPDFNFFQKALETKQGQYDAGYAKISSTYGQLLNSQLLREPNKERRNEFFTGIDNEIKRLSGVDLSLPENVNQASKLFQPLIDNDYFRADLSYTKMYGNAKKKSKGLRDNPNPKDDVKWWAEGDTALDLQAEDFSKSSDDESLRFSSPRYVPKIDVTEKLFKFAKDNDINPETLSQTGRYNIIYANGQAAIPKLQDVFGAVVSGDSRIKDMYATQAYVDRKNAIKTNAEKFGGDEIAAEKDYLRGKVDEINNYYRQKSVDTSKSADNAKTTKKVLENKIRTEGVDPDLDKDLIALYQNSIADEQVMSAVEETNKEALSQADVISFDDTDMESLRYRVDNAMSYFLMDNMVNQTAISYANAKMKILKFEADPYAVNAQEHAFRVSEMATKFGYDKLLKEMDIALEMLKANGGVLGGKAPFTQSEFSGYTSWQDFMGGGQVTGDVAVMEKNSSAQNSVTQTGKAGTAMNANEYVKLQNSRIDAAKTEEEKTMIRQQVTEDLGLYNEVVEKGYTYTEDAPTDWGRALKGLIKFGLGAEAIGAGVAGEISSFGLATPVAVAAAVGGAGLAYSGSDDIYQGLAGDRTIAVPDKVKSKSGLVRQTSDGKFQLVDFENSIGITDPNSGDYWQKVNDRIVARTSTIATTDKNNPAVNNTLTFIAENNQKIQTANKVLSEMQEITVENHKKLIPALANESGVDIYNSGQLFTADLSRRKTQEEYVADFIRAYKDDEKYYPKTKQGGYQRSQTYEISEEERLADMREDAIDNYEDLTDAYETLSKNPDASVGITTFNANIMKNAGGVNKLAGTALSAPFDPVYYDELPFKDAMSLFRVDMGPAAMSEQFRNQKGAKFMYGNGQNITKDDYEDTDNSATAAASMYFAMQAASLNYGGKTNQNTARPTGEWTYYSIAANDPNKVAATFTFNPEFVQANAGKDGAPGITAELAARMSKGEIPQVTFFIDSDKAKSAPFTSMETTMEEFLFERGKLELNYPDGGNVKFSRDALGGISIDGSIPSINAKGEVTYTPVFGTVYNEDINAVYNTWKGSMSNIDQVNKQQKAALSSSSTNKIKDPSYFQPQPEQ